MYSLDIVALKQFYASSLGEMAALFIRRRLASLWPEASGDSTLCLGYMVPYLPIQPPKDIDVFCATPELLQGALCWPRTGPNRTVMMHEGQLPFPDETFNRVVLMHSLETSRHASALLKEVWRVLIPEGRVMVITPNRLGSWAHSGNTPWGYGHPYSLRQLRGAFTEARFTSQRNASALFMPPLAYRLALRAMPLLERIGYFIAPLMGGVLIAEAEKQIYAMVKEPRHERSGVKTPVKATTQPALNPRRSP